LINGRHAVAGSAKLGTRSRATQIATLGRRNVEAAGINTSTLTAGCFVAASSRSATAAVITSRTERAAVIATNRHAPNNFGANEMTPLARKTDPHTSRDAAAKVDGFKAGHEAKIYNALFECPYALTYREIAERTKLEPVAVARRLVAMERRKLITRQRHEVTGKYLARDGMALWFKR